MIAGQLISWIFVCKGIANSVRSLGFDGEFYRFMLLAPHFSDLVFSGSIVMISLVFPIPLLRDKSKLKIGSIKSEVDIMMSIGIGAQMIRENNINKKTYDIIRKDIRDKLTKIYNEQNYYNARIYIVVAYK